MYIEFFYHNPICPSCVIGGSTITDEALARYQVYVYNGQVLTKIQIDYGDKVAVKWIEFFSVEGREKARSYGLSYADSNSIVVNQEFIIHGGDKFVNETYLREIIDHYLALSNSSNAMSTASMAEVLVAALSLGFFESFSPCVIIMLSFIVSYTLSDRIRLKDGFLKVLVFGVGFVAASAVILAGCISLFLLLPSLQIYLMIIACSFALIFGLNLLGLIRIPKLPASMVRKISEKKSLTFFGIFLLGFVFYFLDPCIAPVFASMAAMLFPATFPLTLSFFCLGVIIPFICVGLLVGSISKITRKVYKHRFVFRVLSGLILVGCALYLMLILILI